MAPELDEDLRQLEKKGLDQPAEIERFKREMFRVQNKDDFTIRRTAKKFALRKSTKSLLLRRWGMRCVLTHPAQRRNYSRRSFRKLLSSHISKFPSHLDYIPPASETAGGVRMWVGINVILERRVGLFEMR